MNSVGVAADITSNLSLVEFELFCGEKDEERELREKKKWANFLLLVFNARVEEEAAAQK